MRVYATELICSTGVLGFHTFKLALCIYHKLRSHAEILTWWAFDVTFPGSNPLRSNRSGLNVSNGGSWNPKFTLKVNSCWIKIKGQNFASQVLSRHTFKISRKKGSDFFDHRGTLKYLLICYFLEVQTPCYGHSYSLFVVLTSYYKKAFLTGTVVRFIEPASSWIFQTTLPSRLTALFMPVKVLTLQLEKLCIFKASLTGHQQILVLTAKQPR